MRFALRRHRRSLLFPPGLLALGFLLLLGCLALRPWYRQLRPQYVLQLTLPPKPVSDSILSLRGLTLLRSYPGKKLYLYSQLAGFRSWQDFVFTGAPAQDTDTKQTTWQAFKTMRMDTLHAHSVRIRFGEQATYSSLVRMLEWAGAATPKYLVDFHHGPTTLYAFTEAYRPPNRSGLELPEFCLCNDVLYHHPPPASFETQMQNWFTRWREAWREAFASSAWRLPIALLLGIMAVSSWKMARRWHTA